MWMMGCNDSGDQLRSVQDSFNGQKFRPFMPITASAATSATRNHGTDHFLALNHHFVSVAMAEQNKREFSTQQVVVSSRWNPTPEQLQALEELYCRGVRTPSAEQIQHITAQLRLYGKIEGKNVFYWFQNHKARERQKRRRQHDDQESHNVNQIPKSERKKQSSSGENGTVFEVEQTCKKLASPKKSSTTIAQKSMPTRGAEGSKADGWVQFNEETELEEERRNPINWQMLHLSSSSPSPNNLINYSFSSSATVDTDPLKHQHFRSLDQCGGGCAGAGGDCVEEQATLQLFPARSGCRRPCEEDDRSIVVNYTSTATNVAPDHYQFFEFLPLKK